MKKLFFTILTLLAASFSSFSQSQVDLYYAAEKDVKVVEAKMNKAYKAIIASYDDIQSKNLVVAEQSAWKKYRDACLKALAYDWRGGSGAGLAELMKRIDLTEERLARLQKKL